MKAFLKRHNITSKALLMTAVMLSICLCLAGCDREAPAISGAESVIELDCGEQLNLESYLNEHISITDVTDDGTIEYKLSDLPHTISCEGNAYHADTGEFDTDQFGTYDVVLSVKDLSDNETQFTFSVKLNPLHMNSSVEDFIEMDCGTLFNVNDYFKEHITITNQSNSTKYNLDDYDYVIDCDESVYNASSGKLDTGKFGEYTATLTINSKSFENQKVSFSVKLNPLKIEKGYYVYESGISSSGYDYLGFCEYQNTSDENLEVTSIEFQFFDKDGIMIGSSDMPEYSRKYLASSESGYALDTFSSFNSAVSSKDEITNVEIKVEFKKTTDEDSTSLVVEDMEIINNYDYNVSGFAGKTVVTNPYDKDIEYYALLAGMYDADGKLIGVMNSMGADGINANSKARGTAAWLPDSREIPDKVETLKASARVTLFDE